MTTQDQALRKANPIVVSLWVAIAIFVGCLLFILWGAYETVEAQAKTHALSLSRLVAEHAASSIEQSNLALLDTADHLHSSDYANSRRLAEPRRAEIEAMLKEHQKRSSRIVSMSITDADGYVFANSVGTPPGVSLGDRKYFLELKAQPQSTPVVSDVIKGRVSKRWGVQIARRIEFPDGAFAGMIVANLGLAETFEDFYKTVGIEEDMLITLRNSANQILVRYPAAEEKIGTVLTGSAGTEALLTGKEESVFYSQSPIDQIVRVTALRKLRGYPLFALVGLSKAAVFASWVEQLRAALFLIVGICLAGWFSTVVIVKREAGNRAVQEAHRALEIAHAQLGETRSQLEKSNVSLSVALALAEQHASRDELTKIWNRRTFNQRLEETIARAKRSGTSFCLLIFDLDHFKQINDRLGHHVGDQVLAELAQVVGKRKRESDFFARWGGEEFVLLLEGIGASQAASLAEDIRLEVASHPFKHIDSLTISIGIAEYEPGQPSQPGQLDKDEQDVLQRADQALYAAKAGGRNCVAVSP